MGAVRWTYPYVRGSPIKVKIQTEKESLPSAKRIHGSAKSWKSIDSSHSVVLIIAFKYFAGYHAYAGDFRNHSKSHMFIKTHRDILTIESNNFIIKISITLTPCYLQQAQC